MIKKHFFLFSLNIFLYRPLYITKFVKYASKGFFYEHKFVIKRVHSVINYCVLFYTSNLIIILLLLLLLLL